MKHSRNARAFGTGYTTPRAFSSGAAPGADLVAEMLEQDAALVLRLAREEAGNHA